MATEVVVAPTTPPIRTALDLEMSASMATLGVREGVVVDPAGGTTAGTADGSL